MPKTNDDAVQSRLVKVAYELTGAKPGSPRNRDFCFHMTDWLKEFRRLAALVNAPSSASDSEWESAVHAFLIHASGHILAAAKLAFVEPVQFDLPKDQNARQTSRRSAEPAA